MRRDFATLLLDLRWDILTGSSMYLDICHRFNWLSGLMFSDHQN